ncbi:PLC-like phosphodiesterase [Gautieria morchelliformis]|nr:PLC-like phosphodiesterase [Gautieria morchelliformis]
MSTRNLPECWGHRGASSALPENTLASFEAAIRDGAEGIETGIHLPSPMIASANLLRKDLERTTGTKGLINEKDWYGENGMEHARTVKEPKQSIPTLFETLTLLMKDENTHVQLNIDCKVNNDPDRLFSTMHTCISTFSDWETRLAPRILLGLWHSSFIIPALKHVPYLRRAHIGSSPHLAREYFWSHVEAFSIEFGALCSMEGQRFIAECTEAGKKVLVWTVNKEEEMMEAVRWNVHAILTDVTWVWLELRGKLKADYEQASRLPRSFLWTTFRFYTVMQLWYWRQQRIKLESLRGPFARVPPLITASSP